MRAPIPGIKALHQSAVAQLHAAPQVPDVAVALAELVSNSLDSGARRITVHLTALGPDELAFAVDDDGAGIAAEGFAHLAMAGCTSKLGSVAELLEGPRTLGFKVRMTATAQRT